MKKYLKSFFLIGAVILIIAIVFFIRKVIILSKLDKKICNLISTTNNVYIKTYSTGNNPAIIETFIKGEVQKSIVKKTGKDITMIQFIYPEEKKCYIDNYGNKVYSNQEEIVSDAYYKGIENFVHTTSFIEKILLALSTKITTAEINGKQCYELYGTHSPAFIYSENSLGISAYIEKETGLPVAIDEKINKNGEEMSNTTSYEIKFDCVTDEDMIEPNIEDYVLQENN